MDSNDWPKMTSSVSPEIATNESPANNEFEFEVFISI